jgi:hypothetical protein
MRCSPIVIIERASGAVTRRAESESAYLLCDLTKMKTVPLSSQPRENKPSIAGVNGPLSSSTALQVGSDDGAATCSKASEAKDPLFRTTFPPRLYEQSLPVGAPEDESARWPALQDLIQLYKDHLGELLGRTPDVDDMNQALRGLENLGIDNYDRATAEIWKMVVGYEDSGAELKAIVESLPKKQNAALASIEKRALAQEQKLLSDFKAIGFQSVQEHDFSEKDGTPIKVFICGY